MFHLQKKIYWWVHTVVFINVKLAYLIDRQIVYFQKH